MDPRARRLIEQLGLVEHPEGGWYRETFRSSRRVQPAEGGEDRHALTTIHFLLAGGAASAWHAVTSDEAWHWCEGSPLELWTVPPDLTTATRFQLGAASEGHAPHHVVPAGSWQSARTLGPYTLVGCTVGPGFEFSDFRLAASLPEVERCLQRLLPG